MGAFSSKLQKNDKIFRLLTTLPDDLLTQIYTKYLRRYRLHNGNFIKLIDFEKYKFLERVISRKMVGVSKVNIYEEYTGRELPTKIFEVKYTLPNWCELSDRKEQSIDDDMMYVYLNEITGHYTINQYRLKKIEEFLTNEKPFSMYHRGNFYQGNYHYLKYGWEVFTIASDGSNQYV
jgi:hypothetical protein